MDVRVDTLAADSGRITSNTEVMRQRIRDAPRRTRLAHWSLAKSGTVVACCPRPARNPTKIEIASGHSPCLG
jgi:hypothetical protein